MFWKKKVEQDQQRLKEAYFTASQGQLIRSRFKSNRTAMVAGWALTIMILMGLFAPFLSPHSPNISGRDKEYENGPPQFPKFWDENGKALERGRGELVCTRAFPSMPVSFWNSSMIQVTSL